MRLLTPPATLSEQKRHGYLLLTVAAIMAIAFTVLVVSQNDPWTRLVPGYVVVGLIAGFGLDSVIMARRGTLEFGDQRRRRHYRAGYRAFVVLIVVIGTDMTLDLLDGTPHVASLLIGVFVFGASLLYDERTTANESGSR